ncbi:MAG: 1-acyl-sn-glycerol-3-phosphate acyltransferase [Rhodocyclaceae bacterium]|nr:1-acyl-sn-glycerol-3-phosphate acyltransferase [Rhodocyclaceae bacterium]
MTPPPLAAAAADTTVPPGRAEVLPAEPTRHQTSRSTRAWRLLRLGLHLAEGALTVACLYPLTRRSHHARLRQRWSQRLLKGLGVELQVRGAAVEPGALLVANHVSWLDIFVLNALAPSAFISKAEVRKWPLIGWLSARNATVFLHRGSRGHARKVNAEIAALLDAGHNVAVFPEGTTTDGRRVLHFHAALLQPAIESGHPLQAIALAYRTPSGHYCRAPAYDGDLTLGQCLAAILAEPQIVAKVVCCAPTGTGPGVHRREIAQIARQQIVSAL